MPKEYVGWEFEFLGGIFNGKISDSIGNLLENHCLECSSINAVSWAKLKHVKCQVLNLKKSVAII